MLKNQLLSFITKNVNICSNKLFYWFASNTICIWNIIYFQPKLPGCWSVSVWCLPKLGCVKASKFLCSLSSLCLKVSPVRSSQPLLPPPSTTIPSHAMVGLLSCVLFSPVKNSHLSVTVFKNIFHCKLIMRIENWF